MIRLPCRPRRRGGLAVISESPNSFLLRRGRHQGSGFGGRYEKLRKWKARGDRYPPDGELERRIPASEWVSCVGPAGTIVFCDTSGFHRGGIATTSARIVATWTFCTPAAIPITARRRFTVDYAGHESELSPAARFALA